MGTTFFFAGGSIEMSDAAEIARFERALARKSGAAPKSKPKYGAAAAAELPEEEVVKLPMPGMQQSRSSHALPLPTQKVAGINSRSSSAGALNTGNAAVRKSSEPAAEQEKIRLEDEKMQASIERRKKEREARRSSRK